MNQPVPVSMYDGSVNRAGGAAQRALEILATSRRRREVFGNGSTMFGDPAWDVLLQLIANANDDEVMISDLFIVAELPQTTAMRYLLLLEGSGLIALSCEYGQDIPSALKLTQSGFQMLSEILDA